MIETGVSALQSAGLGDAEWLGPAPIPGVTVKPDSVFTIGKIVLHHLTFTFGMILWATRFGVFGRLVMLS